LELLQLHADAGPCLLVYRTGEPLFVDDLRAEPERWPAFAMRSVEHGFKAVAALPLRLRDDRIGTLNLFRTTTGPMSTSDIGVAEALAAVAAIGIMHERVLAKTTLVARQLNTALETRVVIEQAKGMLAERGGLDMDDAFALLRKHARNSQRQLSELASRVVDGTEADAVLQSQRR
jgi:GAF domain-containing protein